jgi:site-specific recombinase XerC
VSLVAAVNEFLTSKARAGRSDRYLRQLRVVLSSLVAGRSQTPIDQVSASDVDRWLRGRGWGDRTRRGYLSDASTFFAWSIRRGWIRENPAKGVDVPRGVSAPPGILTPGQVRELLCDAAAADVGVARVLALRLFAGVRTAESLRLREVDLLGGFVRVEASASKTRRRRLVPIRPNLAAWLALSGGELPVSEKRMRRVLTGRELPSNAARHSFVSYHLAEFGNAGRTALEAGHGEQVLFNHYRELVTPESAREFWGIMPQPAPQGPP